MRQLVSDIGLFQRQDEAPSTSQAKASSFLRRCRKDRQSRGRRRTLRVNMGRHKEDLFRRRNRWSIRRYQWLLNRRSGYELRLLLLVLHRPHLLHPIQQERTSFDRRRARPWRCRRVSRTAVHHSHSRYYDAAADADERQEEEHD
jgi:hypothetical protein